MCEIADYARNPKREGTMRTVIFVIAVVLGSMAPAFAQKAEIEAANAKWIELFNKGDFAGVAALYTADASAFPPGSPIVRGREAIGAMWKGMAEKVGDPRLTSSTSGKRAVLPTGTV